MKIMYHLKAFGLWKFYMIIDNTIPTLFERNCFTLKMKETEDISPNISRVYGFEHVN